MPASELWNKRFFPADHFGKAFAQPCLALPGGTGCPNILCIEPLTEGAIWQCATCGAKHEFYTEVSGKDGCWLKYGVVRLLEGDHARASGEPSIVEFME